MNDETKQIAQEIKESVVEAVTPAVTKSVIDAVEAKMAQQKQSMPVDKDAQRVAARKQTSEMFKDMYSNLENGQRSVTKDLSTGVATDGLELVPEYFNSEVLRVAGKYGVIRRNARVLPMQGKEESWPTLGEVIVSRVGEKAAIPAVAPETGTLKLTAKKVAAIIPMSRELLRDANIAVIDQIAALAGEATAKLEDQWGFLGLTGTEGIWRNATVPSHVMSAGKDEYSDADFDDLLDVMGLINEDALEGMKWYMSFNMFNALRARRATTDEQYIFQSPGAGMPPTIWNMPVEFAKVLPRTTDVSQAAKPFLTLANLSHMMFGQRDGYEVELSREATITSTDGETLINLWEQDMVAIRVMERIDIQLANPADAYAMLETAAS